MAKYFLLASIFILTGCAHTQLTQPQQAIKSMPQLHLTSPVFKDQEFVPAKYTCDGEDINPLLLIEGVGENAKSLVLIVDDPDAPRGDWVHWTLWNIEPGTKEIAENSAPQGAVQGMTDFGSPGWGGPCPPSGVHRYQFKLYALDTILDLPPSAIKTDIESAIQGHILDETMLIGKYSRER